MKEILEQLKALTATIAACDKEVRKSKRAITAGEARVITDMRKQVRVMRKEFIKASALPAPMLAKIFGVSESRIYQIRME